MILLIGKNCKHNLLKYMKFCVVLVTAPKMSEARRLARMLLKAKLCACVNIVKSIDSFFWWENKIDNSKEALLLIKTKRSLFKKLIRFVQNAHSYTVPEIIALPVLGGSKEYLDWLEESCKAEGR